MLSPSHADITHEREALDEFVKTDGWKYFVKHVLAEWQGPGYFARQAIALESDHVEAKVVHKTALEILRVLNWPSDRLEELQGVPVED